MDAHQHASRREMKQMLLVCGDDDEARPLEWLRLIVTALHGPFAERNGRHMLIGMGMLRDISARRDYRRADADAVCLFPLHRLGLNGKRLKPRHGSTLMQMIADILSVFPRLTTLCVTRLL